MELPRILQSNLGVTDEQIGPAMQIIGRGLSTAMSTPGMPIQDAIDLAEFLANVAVGYVRFSPGANTVGGPIELAAITKHEGFKWVRRKYYYDRALNP